MAKIDPRNHLGLVDDKKLEWLGDLTSQEIILLNSLMQEADEFADEDLMKFCQRHIRLRSAKGGKRAELMAKVAIHDEAKRDVVETRTGNPGGDVPKGP
jgi:hypothetical protein